MISHILSGSGRKYRIKINNMKADSLKNARNSGNFWFMSVKMQLLVAS